MGNLQVVSTQNRIYSASEARPAKNAQAFYWKNVFAVDSPTFSPLCAGFCSANAGEIANGNDFTIVEAFIEIGGVVKQFTWSGLTTKVVTDNIAVLIGDEIDLTTLFGFTPTKGTEYALKGIVSVAVAGTGKIPFTVRVNADVTGQQSGWFVYGTDVISAGTVPGPYTLSSGTFDTRPLGFTFTSLGRPTVNVPILFADGDSIWEGVGDTLLAGIHGRGPINRASHDASSTVGSLIACLNLARSGNSLSSVLGAGNSKWQAWLPYVPANSIGAFNYGTNDIGTAGTGSSATTQANVNTFLGIVKAAIPTLKCSWMHVMPRTSSAGGQWINSVDQTPIHASWDTGGLAETHNNWLTTQVGGSLVAVYNTSPVRDVGRPVVFKTDGTTNKWKTADGTHLAPSGNDDVSIVVRAVNATLLAGSSDTVPDSFTFTAATNVAVSTLSTSNTVTISGIDAATPISIVNGEYSIAGGAWVTASGTITNGQTVAVRRTSSSSTGTTVTAVLTIGGVDGTYSVSTVGAADTTPDSFTFTAATGVAISTLTTSNTVTIGGIDSAASVSIANGEYSINGAAFTTSPGTITNGQTVAVRRTSSASNSTTVTAVLTIGGVNGTFSVTTVSAAADTTPNAFSFTAQTGVGVNTLATSNSVTIGGIDAPSPISITNGEYSINGGAFTTASGTISNGNSVVVRRMSSGSNSTAVTAVLSIGGVSGTFSVTTVAPGSDNVPDAFAFSTLINAAISTTYVSDIITVTGTDTSSAISIANGEYSLNGGTTWVTASGTVNLGSTVVVRRASSGTFNTAVLTTLTIGGVTGAFTIITAPSQAAYDAGQRFTLKA